MTSNAHMMKRHEGREVYTIRNTWIFLLMSSGQVLRLSSNICAGQQSEESHCEAPGRLGSNVRTVLRLFAVHDSEYSHWEVRILRTKKKLKCLDMLPSRINAGGVENFGQENLKEHVAWVRLAVDRQYLRQYLAILSCEILSPQLGPASGRQYVGEVQGTGSFIWTPNNLVLARGWKKQTLHNRFVSGLELWNGKQDGESAKSWEDSTGGRGGCVGGGEWQNWQLFVAGSGLWRVRLYWWVFVLPWLQIIPTEVVARLRLLPDWGCCQTSCCRFGPQVSLPSLTQNDCHPLIQS